MAAFNCSVHLFWACRKGNKELDKEFFYFDSLLFSFLYSVFCIDGGTPVGLEDTLHFNFPLPYIYQLVPPLTLGSLCVMHYPELERKHHCGPIIIKK